MKNPARCHHLATTGVILLFLLAGLFTLDDYGMGWDEVTRWKSGDLKLAYYNDLFSGKLDLTSRPMAGDRYPGLFDLALAAWHAAFGGDRMRQGHFLSILFGALGLAATAWLANLVFSARTAFFSTLLLAVLPLFYGHAMINPKDIPFLATYTLGLASVVSVAQQLVLHRTIKWHHFTLCGSAIGLAAASRIPGLSLLGIALVAWPAATLWGAWKHKHNVHPARTPLFLAGGLLLSGIVAVAILMVFFPRAQFQFFSSLPAATAGQIEVAGTMPLIFNGEVMNAADGPVTYVFGFFLVSTPLWMLALLLTGLFLLLRSLARGPGGLTTHFFLQVLFLAAAAVPWAYILLTHPALHDGMRHVLFAVPPLVVLMGYAMDCLLERLACVPARLQRLAWVAAGLLVLTQVAQLYRMHPYQYVSFNLLAGDRATLPDRYETEYWCTSSRHLLEALPVATGIKPSFTRADKPVKVRISGALNSARPFVPPGFALVDSFEEADYYIANTYLRSDLFAEGEVVFELWRGGIPIGVIKKLAKED